MRVALGAFAVTFVCSFLPWKRALFITVNGTDGDGVITLFTSAIAFGCILLAHRSTRRRALVMWTLATIAAVTTAFVYAYHLADVSRIARENADQLVDLSVSPQFGLILGACAAPIGLMASVVSIRTRSRQVHPPWGRSDLIVSALAVSTVSFAFAPDMWAISALLVVVSIASVWWSARRHMRTTVIGLAVLGLVISSAGTVYGLVDRTTSESLSDSMTDSLQGMPTSNLDECRDVFTQGRSTSEVDEPLVCLDNGNETYVFSVTWDCADGRTLLSNDYGWGYRDGTWSTVGDVPFDRCNSTASQPCTVLFSDGAITQESWANEFIECFDSAGDIDYVLTSRWPCFDSDDVQLSNRYGWGYVGKPWISGEDSPFC